MQTKTDIVKQWARDNGVAYQEVSMVRDAFEAGATIIIMDEKDCAVVIDIEEMKDAINHKVNSQFCETCADGMDSAICQLCARIVCGRAVRWVPSVNEGRASNVCVNCLAKS